MPRPPSSAPLGDPSPSGLPLRLKTTPSPFFLNPQKIGFPDFPLKPSLGHRRLCTLMALQTFIFLDRPSLQLPPRFYTTFSPPPDDLHAPGQLKSTHFQTLSSTPPLSRWPAPPPLSCLVPDHASLGSKARLVFRFPFHVFSFPSDDLIPSLLFHPWRCLPFSPREFK